MTALSNRVIFLNFLKTFLMNFLMIRWVIFSMMMMILQISTHSILARIRISFLIAEMKTLKLIVTKVNESRFWSDCLHSVVFLTAMSTASFSRISTWTRIQWMWISRSLCSILRISVWSKYWSDCFLRNWMIRIAAWQFVKMTMKRSLKWFFVTFRTRSSSIISSK
jgi:hypothetical protein